MENPPRVFEYASSPFQVPPGQKTASSFGKTGMRPPTRVL
jgi:hypothetical protein